MEAIFPAHSLAFVGRKEPPERLEIWTIARAETHYESGGYLCASLYATQDLAAPGGVFVADEIAIAEAIQLLHDLPRPALVLESGCGSQLKAHLSFPHTLVGIDIDPQQLAKNDKIQVKICADLQTFELPEAEYDLVTCIDVLERLPNPEKAIENMCRTVKPGRYLLIAGPEPYSYKGFVAKYTPYSLRSSIFKFLTGKSASEVLYTHGNSKIFFPTYLKRACSLNALTAFCERHGMRVLIAKGYDVHSEALRGSYKRLLPVVNFFTRLVLRLTSGKVNLLHADYVALLKKCN